LTLKNSNGSDGIAAIELVSDAGAEVGDAYELQSLNGTFTISSDHSTKGTYDDTYLTIAGNATPASSTTTIAGGLTISADLNTSGAVYRNIETKSSAYTIGDDEYVIITTADNASSIYTLPTPSSFSGRVLIFIRPAAANAPRVTGHINNSSSTTQYIQQGIHTAYCDGTTWWMEVSNLDDGS